MRERNFDLYFLWQRKGKVLFCVSCNYHYFIFGLASTIHVNRWGSATLMCRRKERTWWHSIYCLFRIWWQQGERRESQWWRKDRERRGEEEWWIGSRLTLTRSLVMKGMVPSREHTGRHHDRGFSCVSNVETQLLLLFLLLKKLKVEPSPRRKRILNGNLVNTNPNPSKRRSSHQNFW